jgi:hypothetical protein
MSRGFDMSAGFSLAGIGGAASSSFPRSIWTRQDAGSGRTRRALDHRGPGARRRNDNDAGLVEAQAEYAAWLGTLPDSLHDSAIAEALRAICKLDLTELQAIEPPRGFGRAD